MITHQPKGKSNAVRGNFEKMASVPALVLALTFILIVPAFGGGGAEENNASPEINATISRVVVLQETLDRAVAEGNPELARQLTVEIASITETARSAGELMKLVDEKIVDAYSRGLDVTETKKMLSLAAAAFKREDYETALDRLRKALVVEALETSGEVNIVTFLMKFWWAVLIAFSASSLIAIITYRWIRLRILSGKVGDMEKEESTIHRLMTELQYKHFKEKTLSAADYHNLMHRYEKRLAEIKNTLSAIDAKTKTSKLDGLKQRCERVKKSLGDVQDAYYVNKSLNRENFKLQSEAYNEQLVRIEEEILLEELELDRKNGGAGRWKNPLIKKRR